jgi:hypothetical protein
MKLYMAHLARLYGDSAALYYLGALLRQTGLEVEAFCESKPLAQAPLRPVRLQRPAVALLKELLSTQMLPHFFLEKAPTLDSWSEVGSLSHEGYFDNFQNRDRWVDSAELKSRLRKIFEDLGGRVFEEPLQRLPNGKGANIFEIMDLDPLAIESSMRAKFFPQLQRRPLCQIAEIWMPFAKDVLEEPSFEFTKIDSTLALSEEHPKGGRVISLFASSQYSLQRALHSLKNPRGLAPTSWKARVLAEGGGAQERLTSCYWGPAGFYRPGVWALGSALGTLNPVHNLNVSDSMRQAERLFSTYRALPRGESLLLSSEDWRRREIRALARDLRRSQFTEKLIFSSRWSSLAQATWQFLPPILRQSLKTPI